MSAPTSGAGALIDINKLIDGAKAGNLDAARQLADTVARALEQPDRRIGSFFMPRRRGGDHAKDRRVELHAAYRDLARAEFGRTQITQGQANRIARKVERTLSAARRAEGESILEQDALQDALDRIKAAGLKPLGARRLYAVLAEGVD